MNRATAELSTVQSNVTARVSALEDELGVLLFQRHARGVKITPAGRRMLPFSARIARLLNGCRNAAELWRRLQMLGFRVSLRVVSEWTTRRRRAEKATDRQLQKEPSARTIARLITTARDHLSKADTVTIAAIEARVPTLVEARTLVERFQTMLRQKLVADLEPWIAAATDGLIGSFASGITKDKAAVRAAITEPWSNGQTEGQITKLKPVKRQMYGRENIELLQARLIA